MTPDHAPLNPAGYVMPVTVRAAFPLLLMVSGRVAVVFTGTLPNASVPLRAMTRVEQGAVANVASDPKFVPPEFVPRTRK